MRNTINVQCILYLINCKYPGNSVQIPFHHTAVFITATAIHHVITFIFIDYKYTQIRLETCRE